MGIEIEEQTVSLKSSFAAVLRRIRSKRNISQRNFGDTSRTYLSKLESGRSSITLDKLGQISERLDLSPLTLMTLTICESTGQSAAELMANVCREISSLGSEQHLPAPEAIADAPAKRISKPRFPTAQARQTELCF